MIGSFVLWKRSYLSKFTSCGGPASPRQIADVFASLTGFCASRGAMEEDAPHPWTCGAPVFRPSEEEFGDFEAFVRSIEPACADYGIAKVVPPPSWHRPSAPAWSKSSLCSAPARLRRLLTGFPAGSLGTQPLPRVLELAASNAAHVFAFDPPRCATSKQLPHEWSEAADGRCEGSRPLPHQSSSVPERHARAIRTDGGLRREA